MNAIIGFTNVVLKTELDEKQREYITAVKSSGDALIILINDILDLAKVDAGKMTFTDTPFSLSVSISTMLLLFESKIKEKNIELILNYDDSIPEILLGDSMRLRQIILNLVSNAVKFTHTGEISVGVKMLREDADEVTIEFTLSDTGIGIPENRLKGIFNDFEQAGRETSSSYGGTGLGLAIVKQLVELQSGSIEVKSTLGTGSVFKFTLKFRKPQEVEQALANKSFVLVDDVAPEAINMKVLVAEDVAMNQLLIRIILLDFGFELDIVDNGESAIEKLKANNYDIVLMDLQMPVMNGFEATTYIRQQMKSSIPIIALTADVTAIDFEKCREVGMNDYISKPIDEALLYKKMIACLKMSEAG
jgi:CheY-like chemotaxis protein